MSGSRVTVVDRSRPTVVVTNDMWSGSITLHLDEVNDFALDDSLIIVDAEDGWWAIAPREGRSGIQAEGSTKEEALENLNGKLGKENISSPTMALVQHEM